MATGPPEFDNGLHALGCLMVPDLGAGAILRGCGTARSIQILLSASSCFGSVSRALNDRSSLPRRLSTVDIPCRQGHSCFSRCRQPVKTLIQRKKNCKLVLQKFSSSADASRRSEYTECTRVCYPHFESPQLRHVTHPSMRTTALVEHFMQICASAG